MSQSLDDMHAFLPDLKYRPPFLLNLLVCLIDDDLLSLIWVIFVVWLLAYSSWPMQVSSPIRLHSLAFTVPIVTYLLAKDFSSHPII